MEELLTAKELKAQGSLVELLSRLGFQPVPKRGRERMYHSILRNNDSEPSFIVNNELGVWFDHGLGKGANIIDFGMAYWKNLSFNEVVSKIRHVCALKASNQKVLRPRMAAKGAQHYRTSIMMEILTHNYLKMRDKCLLIFEKKRDNLTIIPLGGAGGNVKNRLTS